MGIGKSRLENAEKRKLRKTALRMIDIKDRERVEAYLVKSSLQSCESVNDKLDLSLQASTLTSTVCHWALVFVFANYIVTIDGVNEDGKLVSRYRRVAERPAGQYYSLSNPGMAMLAAYRTVGDEKMPTLANLTVSPNDLRIAALKTERNNYKDCQTWAVNAAWSLVYGNQQRGTREGSQPPPTYQEATSTQDTESANTPILEDPVEWSFCGCSLHVVFILAAALFSCYVIFTSNSQEFQAKKESNIGVVQKTYRDSSGVFQATWNFFTTIFQKD